MSSVVKKSDAYTLYVVLAFVDEGMYRPCSETGLWRSRLYSICPVSVHEYDRVLNFRRARSTCNTTQSVVVV